MTAIASTVALPTWACVSDKRRAHIERVTALLEQWAAALRLSDEERRLWRDAGLLHDALRDAPEPELRALAPELAERSVELLHGPAVARRLEEDGERRPSLLDAIRHHTVGYPAWDRVGRALYMADFLEPGRRFRRGDRAFLARQLPSDFDGVFRQVVRMRLEYAITEGHELFPETVSLWNAVR